MKELLLTNLPSVIIVAVFIIVLIVLSLRGKKNIVAKILYALVTEAEAVYGSGTGSVKFAWVCEQLYAKLPLVIKLFITYDRMQELIEKALEEAKKHWAEEAGIQQYFVESGMHNDTNDNVASLPAEDGAPEMRGNMSDVDAV